MTNLADYANSANSSGFAGNASMAELDQLQKALDAGQLTGRDTNNSTTAGGAPLKVESLEKTLKLITFKENDIVLWKRVPKKAAYNTVEEYNQLTSYGTDRGGFYKEGELPNEEDSTYVRRSQFVKFMGVTKSVTHPMQLVNIMPAVGNIVEREIKNGTQWILRKLNQSLYFGDEALCAQEFNGFLAQQMRADAFGSLGAYYGSEVVVDLRGVPLGEKHIEKGAEGIVENFGLGTQLYAPPAVLSDFVKGFYGNKFIQPNTEMTANGIMGQRVNSFDSQFGRIGLNYDIFFNKKPSKKNTTAATAAQAPPAVTGVTATPVGSDASGIWAAGDAGAYFYAVVANNRFGESAVAVTGSASTIVTGGAVDITFTDGGGTYPAESYTVLRSNKGAATAAAATFYPLYTVSLAEVTAGYDGASASGVRDRNRILPNCNQAMLVQEDNEVIEFAQLAPLMKMDLAVLSPAYRFMVLLYGTPFLYAPKKIVRFVNIGAAA